MSLGDVKHSGTRVLGLSNRGTHVEAWGLMEAAKGSWAGGGGHMGG